jgi:hypothetical protein
MKNRGFLLLLLLLTLTHCAKPVSAQTPALYVQVYDYAGLSPVAVHEFVARAQEILARSGVSLEMDICSSNGDPCESHTGGSRQLTIRVVTDAAKSLKNVRLEKLGMSVAGHNGGTYATVFLKAAEEKASDENIPRGIVLAYATAHEIGHLLLGDQAHTSRGLMKATWNSEDFREMAQDNLHFSPEQARELISHYGTARQVEAARN